MEIIIVFILIPLLFLEIAKLSGRKDFEQWLDKE